MTSLGERPALVSAAGPVMFPTSAERGKRCIYFTISRKVFCLAFSPASLKSAGLPPVLVLHLLRCWGVFWLLQLPSWCCGCEGIGGCRATHSGNPNIAPCDQVLTKKSSNPYLGQVQGLKFLIALFPGSAACAALNTF